MTRAAYPQVKKLVTIDQLRARLDELDIDLPTVDRPSSGPDSPLAQPLDVVDRRAGNRFAVLPMEGWDGTSDGHPTDLVRRRWQRFGRSGAKLIWGGEAVAVEPGGRANPNQLSIHTDGHGEALGELRGTLVAAHHEADLDTGDLVTGLQLTHSGRFSRPGDEGPAPVIAERHPVLDSRLPAGRAVEVISDERLDGLVESYVSGAVRAAEAGFDFVDIKACHGYLGHELLGAVDRPGRYGGDLDGRSHLLRSVVAGIQRQAPGLGVGVRLSLFDFVPFSRGLDGVGEPHPLGPSRYRHAFGGDGSGLGIDLAEPIQLIDRLAGWGVNAVCVTAGSPYYVPHVQRPAWFPPSDGYQPPEDPLVGVARLIGAAAELKRARPDTVVVGSGYSYLQEWLAHVAESVVAQGWADSIGVGRMVLSYPELPHDVLTGRPLDRRRICRTFSDCTTAPRAGLVSGCYPLDDHYKKSPERQQLVAVKASIRRQAAAR